MIEITGAISLDERELEERFVLASGPGGQNVNKVLPGCTVVSGRRE